MAISLEKPQQSAPRPPSTASQPQAENLPRVALVCSIPTTTDILPIAKHKLRGVESGASAQYDGSFYRNAHAMASERQLTLNPSEHVSAIYRCADAHTSSLFYFLVTA